MRRRKKLPVFGKYPSNGEYYVYCDRSGRKMRKKDTLKTWDGFIVQPKDWEPRQPLDFPPKVRPERRIWDTRPEPSNNFFTCTFYVDADGEVIYSCVPRDLTQASTVQIAAVRPTISNATAEVAEDAAPGTVVVTVSASDPQGLDLTYSILSGNNTSKFFINATTGVIQVNNLGSVTAGDIFSLVVQAENTQNIPNTATVTITVAAGYDGQILSLSPSVYFKLSDTSGSIAVDASSNGNNGAYENAAGTAQTSTLDDAKLAPGLTGKSPVFQSKDITQPNTSDIAQVRLASGLDDLAATTGMSVVIWVDVAENVLNVNQGQGNLISIGTSSNLKYKFRLNFLGGSDSRLEISLGDPGDSGATTAWTGRSASAIVNVQDVHMFAFTFAPSAIVMYVDGSPISITTVAGTIPASLALVPTSGGSAVPLTLGLDGNASDPFFGNLQAAAQVNTTLTAQQISDIYAAGNGS